MTLSAQSIRERLTQGALVSPAHPRTEVVWWGGEYRTREKISLELGVEAGAQVWRQSKKLSFGLSGCGYDVRLAQDIWLWPFWGRLGSTIEHFRIPDDLKAEVKDKSSNARRFVTVQNTIIEPGWHGYLTLELTRHLPWPVLLRRGTPIAQIVFEPLDFPTDMPYRGKYQAQPPEPVPAR